MKDALWLIEPVVTVVPSQYPWLVEHLESNSLVCPECWWQVKYVSGNWPYFKHDVQQGNGIWKTCKRYVPSERSMEGGTWKPPVWETDDLPTIHQVLNGYVIHVLAKKQEFFGADRSTYLSAAEHEKIRRLMDEPAWTNIIIAAAERAGRFQCTLTAREVFLRYLTGTAQSDDPALIRRAATPFKQMMALAWSSAGNRLRALLRLLPATSPATRKSVQALLSLLDSNHDHSIEAVHPGPITGDVRALLEDALRIGGFTSFNVTARQALEAMVVSAFLGIVDGLDVEALLSDPSSVIEGGGYIYIAGVWRSAFRPVGVKIGRTDRLPHKRELEHYRNSAGAIRRMDRVRFVADSGKVEARFKEELDIRKIPPLLDYDDNRLGKEWFACSVATAYTILNEVLNGS